MADLLTATDYQRRMESYANEGKKRAQRFGNRGPILVDENGILHSDIVRAYWEHGFYVFSNALSSAEVGELKSDVMSVLEHAPVGPGQIVDAYGEPAVGIEMKRYPYHFVKPLSDPVGGTESSEGRHMSKMAEASPRGDAPEYVIQIIAGMCQLFESGLRVLRPPLSIGGRRSNQRSQISYPTTTRSLSNNQVWVDR